jgi:hypothetical protein
VIKCCCSVYRAKIKWITIIGNNHILWQTTRHYSPVNAVVVTVYLNNRTFSERMALRNNNNWGQAKWRHNSSAQGRVQWRQKVKIKNHSSSVQHRF